jgi:hypothetical protein
MIKKMIRKRMARRRITGRRMTYNWEEDGQQED